MGMPVRMLQRLMPYREFLEWVEFSRRYPFDDESQQIGLALLTAYYVNAHLPSGAKPKSIVDFLPFRPKEELSLDDKFKYVLGRIAAGQNNDDIGNADGSG